MRSAAAFLALTFALAWALWIPLALRGVTVGPGDGWPSHLPGLVAPAIAAVLVVAATRGAPGLAELARRVARLPSGPMASRVVLIVALTTVCACVPLLESPRAPWEAFVTYSGAPRAGLWVLPYVAIVNGLGEELGWRGYLVDWLALRIGGKRAALVTWGLWATWHGPLFFVVDTFRAFGVLGALGWLVGLGCGSLVLTWLYVASGRSVLVPALWHTAYNFATATSASTPLSSALATAIALGVSVGLVRHRGFWEPFERGAQPRA